MSKVVGIEDNVGLCPLPYSELHKINRLFVGRELRMVELKERIRALEKKVNGKR
jgi:hypothetical protein